MIETDVGKLENQLKESSLLIIDIFKIIIIAGGATIQKFRKVCVILDLPKNSVLLTESNIRTKIF